MSERQETCEVLTAEDEVGRAALALASWKYIIPERRTCNKLQKMKTATLSEYDSGEGSSEQKKPAPNVPFQLPEPGKNIDGTRLPDYPPLPALRHRISKISPPLLRQLTDSDVADNQQRLPFTTSFAKEHYEPMLKGGEDLKKGVKVTTYGPDGIKFPMDFRMWGDIKTFVLTGGWKKFYKEHKLQPCTYWVTVWMFRDDTDHLCFALDWIFNESTQELITKKSKRPRIGK